MKAIAISQYGGPEVLKLTQKEKPIIRENEILVKVKAASVNYGDLIARNFKAVKPKDFNMPGLFWIFAKLAFGISKPNIKILGSEFSGTVEAVGSKTDKFKIGDAIFGYQGQAMGTYCEYIKLNKNSVAAHIPKSLNFEQAASMPYGAIMALPLLKKAKVGSGQKILVIGASGSIGAAALQIAKHWGAEVHGVCGSKRTAYVQSLGADRAIDYTKEDLSKLDEKYDLVLDILGSSSFKTIKKILKPKGTYFLASFKLKQLMQMLGTSFSSGQKVRCAIAPGSLDDLMAVKELTEAGALTALVDKSFPMEEASQAHAYAESGQATGKVVIRME